MTVRNPPAYMGGLQDHSVQDDRLNLGALFLPAASNVSQFQTRSGVLPGGGFENPAGCTVVNATTVTIDPFRALVQGTNSALQGVYLCTHDNTAVATLTYAAASTTQWRRDIVVAEVLDADNGGGTGNYIWRLRVVQGAYGGSAGAAVRPTTPPNSVALWELYLAPTAAATLTDLRPWTTLRGDAVQCLSTARPSNPAHRLRIYEIDTRNEYVWDAFAAAGSGRWRWQRYYGPLNPFGQTGWKGPIAQWRSLGFPVASHSGSQRPNQYQFLRGNSDLLSFFGLAGQLYFNVLTEGLYSLQAMSYSDGVPRTQFARLGFTTGSGGTYAPHATAAVEDTRSIAGGWTGAGATRHTISTTVYLEQGTRFWHDMDVYWGGAVNQYAMDWYMTATLLG